MDLREYNKVRDFIRTGDIIAFSGNGWQSNTIKNFTTSQYSHVGMAIWITPTTTMEPRLFIAESTTLNNTRDINGEYRKGVQIVAMAQRLEGYDGQAWWFPIKDPLNEQEKIILFDWIWDKSSNRVPYDTAQAIAAGLDVEKTNKFFRFITSPFKRWTENREDMRKLFCSELCTKALQLVGRVDMSINASEQTPQDVLDFDIYIKPSVSLCRSEEKCEI